MNYTDFLDYKKRKTNEIFNKYVFYALTDYSLQEELDKRNSNINIKEKKNLDKLISLGASGFVLKKDKNAFEKALDTIGKIKDNLIRDKEKGIDFCCEMFIYELNNHEYSYTNDIDDTLANMGLTRDKIARTPNLKKGLRKALKDIRETDVI